MRLRGILLVILIALMLSGCTAEGSSSHLSKEDLSIKKVEGGKSKVEYGMSRSDVEKVLGTGEKSTMGFFTYGNGVTIMYRNDKVAGISLDKEAADKYQTPKIKIGMLKSEVKEVYGEENILLEANANLDYAYDIKTGAFLTQESKPKGSAEEMEEVYLVSVMFDDDGYAERIMLLDQRMAIIMN